MTTRSLSLLALEVKTKTHRRLWKAFKSSNRARSKIRLKGGYSTQTRFLRLLVTPKQSQIKIRRVSANTRISSSLNSVRSTPRVSKSHCSKRAGLLACPMESVTTTFFTKFSMERVSTPCYKSMVFLQIPKTLSSLVKALLTCMISTTKQSTKLPNFA